jgi:putative flippase GtrA
MFRVRKWPAVKRTDAVVSLVIGGMAALLMLAVSQGLALPAAARPYLAPVLLAFPLVTLAAIALGSFVGRRVGVVYQFTKYALVGGLNFLLDLGVLNVLITVTSISQGAYANGLKAISFLVAVTWSYFWNRFWTFSSASASRPGRQFVKFFVVSAAGILINVSAFAVINGPFWAHRGIPARTWANVAAAGASLTSVLWNFLGYKFVVFRRRSVATVAGQVGVRGA